MLRFLFGVLVLAGAGVLSIYAQTPEDLDRLRSGVASNYNFSEPADVTIYVSVWGTVRSPGLYEIPEQTRLSRLWSLSGGPIVGPRQRRQDRTIRVRLFREGTSGRELIFEAEMQNEVIPMEDDPVLQEGDVLAVETLERHRFGWRDAISIVSAAGTLTLLTLRITGRR